MTEDSSPDIARLMLPFAVPNENRKEPLTKEMERAAAYCYAELERAKGGGILLKQPAEEITFVALAGYPFWLVPWNKLTLLVDGLNTMRHTIAYKAIADPDAFKDDMVRSSKSLEPYIEFLLEKINYYQPGSGEESFVLNGLAGNTDLLSEFNAYLTEASEAATQSLNIAMLPPAVDESAASNLQQELEKARTRFQHEAAAFYENMKLLNKTTNSFTKNIRASIKAVKEKAAGEIAKIEEVVTPKVRLLQQEYDSNVVSVTGNFEKQLLPLHKDKAKLEKMMEQTKAKIERAKIEAKTSDSRKDTAGKARWKDKLKEHKKELSDLEARIKDVDTKIREMEQNRSAEIFRLKSENEAKIGEAKKDLLELESSRDAQIQVHQQKLDRLKEYTAAITVQIDAAAKLREADILELERVGIQQKSDREALVYVPFYVVCYRSQNGMRFTVIPPSLAGSVGLSTKLKGALGMAKVKQLLTPRFKATSSLLLNLPNYAGQRPVLQRQLYEAGVENDLLRMESSREGIRNGLVQLRAEEWLSEKEYETFVQSLDRKPA